MLNPCGRRLRVTDELIGLDEILKERGVAPFLGTKHEDVGRTDPIEISLRSFSKIWTKLSKEDVSDLERRLR
jgi:hypothetical protein